MVSISRLITAPASAIGLCQRGNPASRSCAIGDVELCTNAVARFMAGPLMNLSASLPFAARRKFASAPAAAMSKDDANPRNSPKSSEVNRESSSSACFAALDAQIHHQLPCPALSAAQVARAKTQRDLKRSRSSARAPRKLSAAPDLVSSTERNSWTARARTGASVDRCRSAVAEESCHRSWLDRQSPEEFRRFIKRHQAGFDCDQFPAKIRRSSVSQPPSLLPECI